LPWARAAPISASSRPTAAEAARSAA
jgi:hypothetical protein